MYLPLPSDEHDLLSIQYTIIVGNRNTDRHSLTISNFNYLYGTNYLDLRVNKDILKKIRERSPTKTGFQKLKLGRNRVKAANTDQKRCDETNSAINPFKCGSIFLEGTTGCSLGASVENPNQKRLYHT